MDWSLLDPANVEALGWTLVHFTWQGLLGAALMGTLLVTLRGRSSSARYVAALSVLLAMLAAPLVTLFMLIDAPSPRPPGLPLPASEGVTLAPSALEATGVAVLSARHRLESALPWLVAAWVAGVLFLSLRAFGGWLLAQRLKRSGLPLDDGALRSALARLCRRMGVQRAVRLCESALVAVPTAIGWLRPVILFPAATLAGLSPAQLELILAHELAHIRRLDYLVNLLQTLAETLLFYHPAVWWVSHRLRLEREHCCDEAALRAGGDAVAYARALTDLEALRARPARLALAASGGSLAARVRRVLGLPDPPARRPPRWAAGALALLAALLATSAASSLRASNRPSSDRVDVIDQLPSNDGDDLRDLVEPASARAATPRAAPADPACNDTEGDEVAIAEAEAAAEAETDAVEEEVEDEEAVEDAVDAEVAGGLTLAQVIELAKEGVTPDYLDEMDGLGYGSLSAQELRELRSHGVSADFVRELKEQGCGELSPGQLVALRSQGVDGDFVRELREQGIEGLSVTSLISLRSHGVDPEQVRAFRDAGYRDLSTTDLIALRSHGVDPDEVVDLKALGYADLSVPRLIALRSMGVDAAYVQELSELGLRQLSVPMLIALRSHGVDPDDLRGLKEAGYGDLTAGVLVELRNHGVTADFAEEMKEAAGRRLDPAELIDLKSHGVDSELVRRMRARHKGSE